MDERFVDRTVVVTGGTSGIGRAIARRFGNEGANVAVADIRESPRTGGKPTHELIRDEGGTAKYIECNVAKEDSLDAAFSGVFEEYRTLEILINGAGVIVNKPLTDVSVDDYEYLMDINLKGAYFACRQAIGNMLEHDTAGSIVNISSIGGLLGGKNSSLYCASKAGLANLTRALAVEYGPEEIRVNAINPGPIKTALTRNDAQSNHEAETGDIPLRRMGDPQDIADVALFLASDAAAYVTGHNLVVDGGLTARY